MGELDLLHAGGPARVAKRDAQSIGNGRRSSTAGEELPCCASAAVARHFFQIIVERAYRAITTASSTIDRVRCSWH